MASLAPLRARVQSFRYIQFVFFERFTYPGFIGLLSALFSPRTAIAMSRGGVYCAQVKLRLVPSGVCG